MSRRTKTPDELNATSDTGFTIDIMSVGSRSREDYLISQHNTWASHPSVRYFFGLTEDDDADPLCHEHLTRETMERISGHCLRRKNRQAMWNHSYLMQLQTNNFAHGKYLNSKSPGWLCGQKRPSHGIGKLSRFYRGNSRILPDFLLIVDDDTYINMDWFTQQYRGFNTSLPRADAGCLVINPAHMTNFSFPFGGF